MNSFTFRCHVSVKRENFGDNKIYKNAADSETSGGKTVSPLDVM